SGCAPGSIRNQRRPSAGGASPTGVHGSNGEVPKWPKGADCKSAGERLRGFKSSPRHHRGAEPRGGSGLADDVCGAVGRAAGRPRPRPDPWRPARQRGRAGGRDDAPTASRGNRGKSSGVGRQPSKVGVAGSNPVSRSSGPGGVSLATGRPDAGPARTRDVIEAHVAQSVEHVLGKDGVTGSSPVMGSSPLAGRSAR